MRCVSGQLRTHLNLGAQENMTYASLREQCLKWDRAQQRWSGLITGDDQVVPMEIDRVKGKGKWSSSQKGYGGKSKGKNDKGGQKGDYKGKSKGKDGKGKSY